MFRVTRAAAAAGGDREAVPRVVPLHSSYSSALMSSSDIRHQSCRRKCLLFRGGRRRQASPLSSRAFGLRRATLTQKLPRTGRPCGGGDAVLPIVEERGRRPVPGELGRFAARGIVAARFGSISGGYEEQHQDGGRQLPAQSHG
eukprot:424106-Rhodomonas_salina.4